MNMCSTKDRHSIISFTEAVERGLADDGGLFIPVHMPVFASEEIAGLRGKTLQEIAFEVLYRVLHDEFGPEPLRQIVRESFTFPIPLRTINGSTRILELFHGPTLAFKDVGARFMARMLAYLHRNDNREVTILVATSGDTGSAVAHGFHGVSGTRVVLLYPSGKVSRIQEQQMTTVGGNVVALEVEGTFDDCQQLVKQAFADEDVRSRKNLSTANSINCARLFPQMVYYFFAALQLEEDTAPPVFAVPSGNLGNLTAGLLAHAMGLPARSFIAACNANDVLPEYLHTGLFRPRASIQTISNAMDVGNPSNFARLAALFDGNHSRMQCLVEGATFTDLETRDTIRSVFDEQRYVLDPHSAIAYRAWTSCRRHDGIGIVLATAHPAKFAEVYDEQMSAAVDVPDQLRACMKLPKQSLKISSGFPGFKSFLIQ